MKIPNDTIGNRTRDLLACSAVPQPTAPTRAPVIISNKRQILPQLFHKQVNQTWEQERVTTGSDRSILNDPVYWTALLSEVRNSATSGIP